MKQLLLLLVIVVTSLQTLQAQTPTWQWGRRCTGSSSGGTPVSNNEIIDMVTDKSGNTYTLLELDGAFSSRFLATSNDIPLKDTSIASLGSGYTDAVLVSYNSCGKLRWFKTFYGVRGSRGFGIGIDSLTNIYSTFYCNGGLVKIATDTTMPNLNDKGTFLVKYDSTGKFKWVKSPCPDTAKKGNNYNWLIFNSLTTPAGDTYTLLYIGNQGKGLISGSNNLVINQKGYYVLKYNSAGVPKELIKLDINLADDLFFYSGSIGFHRISGGKYVFSFITDYYGVTSPSYFGNQKINTYYVLGCFSPTGQFLWKVNNADSAKGAGGRTYWDEDSKYIYISGSIQNSETYLGVTAPVAPHQFFTYAMVACIDTNGNKVWLKHSLKPPVIVNGTNAAFVSCTITPNGTLVSGGDNAGQLNWGGAYTYDSRGISQGNIFAFDKTNGNVLAMDSVRDDGGRSVVNVYTSDNNNNVYAGIRYTNHLFVGNQEMYKFGDGNDVCIAKWGFNNCSTVPLKFINYTVSSPLLVGGGFIQNNWQTANEINVSHFNLQRCTNGKDFITIGVVMAKNKATNNYQFIDPLTTHYSPFTTLYYRLESIDYDGQKQYSEIKTLTINRLSSKVNIYPNPANTQVIISCANAKAIEIVDYLGKLVFTKNTINNYTTINVRGWAKGIYLVKILLNTGEIKTEKLVVE